MVSSDRSLASQDTRHKKRKSLEKTAGIELLFRLQAVRLRAFIQVGAKPKAVSTWFFIQYGRQKLGSMLSVLLT